MSRTDKTDPGWLKEYLYGDIEHDHRGGVCVEETLDAARPARNWHAWNRHLAVCPKREYVEVPCPEDYTCWTWRSAKVERVLCRTRPNSFVFRDIREVAEHKHTKVVNHPEVSCEVCDNRPPAVTCDRRIPGRYYKKLGPIWGNGPTGEFREQYENTARREMRDALRAAARDYNANGDTEIEPEPVRHRHCAGWDWW